LPENLQRISHRLSNITEQLKGTEIDENLSLRVVRTVLELQTFHLQQKVMLSHERRKRIATANSRNQVCQLLHISTRIYGRIIHKYLLEHEMYVSSKEQSSQSGNTDSKNIRIPWTRAPLIVVHAWVRENRSRKESDCQASTWLLCWAWTSCSPYCSRWQWTCHFIWSHSIESCPSKCSAFGCLGKVQ